MTMPIPCSLVARDTPADEEAKRLVSDNRLFNCHVQAPLNGEATPFLYTPDGLMPDLGAIKAWTGFYRKRLAPTG